MLGRQRPARGTRFLLIRHRRVGEECGRGRVFRIKHKTSIMQKEAGPCSDVGAESLEPVTSLVSHPQDLSCLLVSPGQLHRSPNSSPSIPSPLLTPSACPRPPFSQGTRPSLQPGLWDPPPCPASPSHSQPPQLPRQFSSDSKRSWECLGSLSTVPRGEVGPTWRPR